VGVVGAEAEAKVMGTLGEIQILIIDDDARLAQPLAQYFQRFNLTLDSATTPSEGLAMLRTGRYSAAILDVMLPEMDGFELCRTIRKTSNIPLIMLTARGDVMDRVVGLELGADDYLAKPFEPRELVARIQTVLRRQVVVDQPKDILSFAELSINLNTHEVRRQDEMIDLTGTEFALLVILAKSPGKVFSRDDLLNSLRGHETDIFTRSVDILISRLRKKLEPLDCIRTLRNAGYSLALSKH
jgi:two-component system, OmpR family, response regulator